MIHHVIIRWYTVITKLSNYATDLLFWVLPLFSCCGSVSLLLLVSFIVVSAVFCCLWRLFSYWCVLLLYFLLFLHSFILYCWPRLWFEATAPLSAKTGTNFAGRRDLDLLIGTGHKVILAEDFNAKHVTWGARQNNTIGQSLLKNTITKIIMSFLLFLNLRIFQRETA
jgi:hypothetical protein